MILHLLKDWQDVDASFSGQGFPEGGYSTFSIAKCVAVEIGARRGEPTGRV